MSATNRTGALAPFLSGQEGVQEVWARMDIEGRRAVLQALVEVTFLRTDRKAGRVFDPNTVKIVWTTEKAPIDR